MSGTTAAGTVADPTLAPHGPAPAAASGRWSWGLAVVLAAVTGLAVRAASMLGAGGELNSDEAIEALIAVHLLHHGHLPPFFWGQWYGGTAEAVAAAAAMRVVGENAAALQLVQFAEGLAQAVLVWRIGLRVLDPRRAVLAALLVWVWPAAFVLLQARPYLFYELTVVCGLVVLLTALRVVKRPADRWCWAGLGLAAGLGFWSSPQSLYYLLAAGLWLLARLRAQLLRRCWPAVLCALLGAAPWWVTNARHGWRSLRPNAGIPDGPLDRLAALGHTGLPLSLGLRVAGSHDWLLPGAPAAYVLACVALVAAVRPAVRRHGLHLLVLAVFPVVYALIPVLAEVTNGRYFLFLGAPLALVLASLAGRRWAATALLLTCTATTVLAVPRTHPSRVLPSTTGVSALLASRGIGYAYAGYWTSYKLTWESRETVVASPMTFVRYRPYDRAVAAAPRVALVYNRWPDEQAAAAAARGWLGRRGSYEERQVGGYTVLLPDRDVERGELAPEARVQP